MDTQNNEQASIFPSHLVPAEKKDLSWCLQYTKAFHQEFRTASGQNTNSYLRHSFADYQRWRSYARGEQDQNQYKELLSIKKNKGKRNTSYRNLDFSILQIGPKIKDVLFGKIVNKPYDVGVRLIDPDSLDQEKQAKYKMIEYIVNKKQREHLESLGFDLPKPGDAETMPQRLDEIDSYMSEGGYKSEIASQIEGYLDICMVENDFDQIKDEIVSDLIDTGIMAVRVYIDSNGFIRLRRGVPENLIVNECVHNNFKDKIRVGEYITMTIADLKQRVGYNEMFTEDAYRQIAENITGNNGKYAVGSEYSQRGHGETYAYDREKITVLDAVWYSVDSEVKVVRKKNGNKKLYDKSPNYVPYQGLKQRPEEISEERWNQGLSKKTSKFEGLADSEYKELFKGEREIIRNEIKNVYQCCWIVGTDYAFDYGLASDAARSADNLADVEMNWIIQTTNWKSSIDRIEAALDNIQINWLQFQSHVAASKPRGMAMEMRAASRLQSTGKNQKNMSFKDMINFYAETGNYFYDGYDNTGRPLPQKPFEELANGLSADAITHFDMIFKEIELIRFMLGLNEVSDATGPHPRTGVGISEMMNDSTDNALTLTFKTLRRGIKDISKRIVDTIPMALDRGIHTGFVEALGMDSYAYLRMNKELNLRSIGIEMRVGIDETVKDRLYQIAVASVGKGELYDEDSVAILDMNNLYQIRKHLAKRRAEVKMENAKIQASVDQNKAQADQQSALFARQQEMGKLELQEQLKRETAMQMSMLKREEMILAHQHKIDEINAKGSVDQQNIDAKTVGKTVEIDAKGEVDEDLKRMELEAKEKEVNQPPSPSNSNIN